MPGGALAYYARDGRSDLNGFIDLLSELPDDLCDLKGGPRLAADMAEELKAAMIIDPQDFAPSGAATACTESTLKLSAQARKYGLGLMFATQAPRGLHDRIPGNAATQFFGRLNSGVQINAATELARRKGGEVDDIARLTSGVFYAASEGMVFTQVRMPMCWTYHPSSALTEEEVLTRARAER